MKKLSKELLLCSLLILYLVPFTIAQKATTIKAGKAEATNTESLQPVKVPAPAVVPASAEKVKLKPAKAAAASGKGGVSPVKAVIPGQSEYEFRLRGAAKGIEDSTWIFIQSADNSSGKPIDSAMVIQERFELGGSIKESPMLAILRTKSFSDYRFLWLENRPMRFEGERGKFREAKVSGSGTEIKSSELEAQVSPLRRNLDSLYAKIQNTTHQEVDSAALARQIQDVEQEIKQRTISFIRQNPASVVSGYILDVSKSTWGRQTTEELFLSLSEDIRNSSYGSAIKEYLLLNKNPQIGDKYADFTQQTLDGKRVKLSDYKGKVVLLEFWASNCGPCRVENPNLVKTYHNYKDKGFEVLGVSLDESRDNWERAIKKDDLPWMNVSELNGFKNRAALIYGISAIPDNFLIDKEGTIIGRNLRGEKLNARLAELLK